MNLEKIREMQAEWLRANSVGIPTHVLVHPNVLLLHRTENEKAGSIHHHPDKPATINGIEIVPVNPQLYPKDFIKLVGGAE